MADESSQADIRGIDITKLAKGFADEDLVLKRYVTVSKTSAREIRWYQKTAGFVDTADTSGITASRIKWVAEKALPPIAHQTWTRNTSYAKKFAVESEWLSVEDIKDSDIDVLGTMIRDLVRSVQNQVDQRIYNIVGDDADASGNPGGDGNVNTAAATADGWDDAATGDPIKDIMYGLEQIRTYRYNIGSGNVVIYIHPTEASHLMEYLISVKGSSIPNFSSAQVTKSEIMNILGCKVVTSVNALTDYAVMFVENVACTWKSFKDISSAVIDEPLIGKKIRVGEWGEAILTDPRAVHVITDTVV